MDIHCAGSIYGIRWIRQTFLVLEKTKALTQAETNVSAARAG